MRHGRVDVGSAFVPRRERNWPVGWDHQGPWNANSGTDQDDEPQLHGAQVPSDQAPPLQQGIASWAHFRIFQWDKSRSFYGGWLTGDNELAVYRCIVISPGYSANYRVSMELNVVDLPLKDTPRGVGFDCPSFGIHSFKTIHAGWGHGPPLLWWDPQPRDQIA